MTELFLFLKIDETVRGQMTVYNRHRLYVKGYRQFTLHIVITLAALSMQYIIFSLKGQQLTYKR